MLALLTSKLGLYGIAAALIAGAILIQTARLTHAKADLARETQVAAASAAAGRASETLRVTEHTQAVSALSAAQQACAGRVADAVKSGAAIHTLLGKPNAIDPTSHCPLRAMLGSGELRASLGARP